jgi:mono/diheme cytochrome c family protein
VRSLRFRRSNQASGRCTGSPRAGPFLRLLVLATAGIAPAVAFGQAHQPPKVEPDDYVWQHQSNPFSGDAEAAIKGRRLYRSTCYICHLDSGGRGPDLRKSRLKGQDFLRVVIRGKRGTQMPAWQGKLTEDEMWMIVTYLEAPRE